MKINIQKLSEGIHELSEEISAADLSIPSKIKPVGNLRIHAFVDKFEDSFRVKLKINAKLKEHCDKCLVEFDSVFDQEGERIYHLGKAEFEDDEIEILPDNTKEIDLSDLINEVFLINRPIQITCKEDCRGLCPNCGTNLNKSSCSCGEKSIDPRLEKLKLFIK
jgi:uncharacterized protein